MSLAGRSRSQKRGEKRAESVSCVGFAGRFGNGESRVCWFGTRRVAGYLKYVQGLETNFSS